MRRIDVEVFVEGRCLLGEGPFWHAGRLHWVDIERGELLSVDAAGGDPAVLSFGRRLGAAAPVDGGGFVLALEDGVGVLEPGAAAVRVIARPEAGQAHSRFNDGKCDPAGRFVAGTLRMDGREGASALYSIDAIGRCRRLLEGVSISNGLAWFADALYYVDTPRLEIARFDYDPAGGPLGPRSVAVRVPRGLGYPDGMDVDVDGNLWVAHWDGSAVRCWSPGTGECLAEVPVPCARPTSCCFGGPALDELFVTTARVGLDDPGPLAGSVFRCRPGTAGLSARSFAGR